MCSDALDQELEKNPLASYQPFESFMIQPIQRIPRYPLMLKVCPVQHLPAHALLDFIFLAVSRMESLF